MKSNDTFEFYEKLYGQYIPKCSPCYGSSWICENCPYKQQGEYNLKRYMNKITTEFAEKIVNSCREVLEEALKEKKE